MNDTRPVAVYICPNGYLGGAERVVLALVRGHNARKAYRTHILFFSSGPAVELAKQEKFPHSVLKTRFRLRQPFALLRAIFEIRGILKQIKPQVVHYTMPYAVLLTAPALIGIRCATVWFQHGPIGGWMDRVASLLRYDLVFFNSAYTQDCQRQIQLSKSTRAEVIVPLAIAEQRPLEARVAEIRSDTFRHTIGMVGRICSWKGQATLLAAAALLRECSPQIFAECEFLIVGGANRPNDVKYLENLKSLVTEKQLESQVRFLGAQEDVASCYAAIDIFIHASNIPEPFGLVVGEAMLSGCFVIGGNNGGVSEILQDGQTGFTFDASGASASVELCEKIRLAIEGKNSSQLAAMKDRAKNLVRTKFTADKMLSVVEENYAKLLAAK